MGCIAPVPAEGGQDMNSKRTNLQLNQTGIAKIDELYTEPSALINKYSATISAIEEKEKELYQKTAAKCLKKRSITDAIVAMLYIYASNTSGEFNQIDLKFHSDLPFITVNETLLHDSQREIPNTWESLLRTYEASIQSLNDVKDTAHRVVNNCKTIENAAKGILFNEKLKAKKKVRVDCLVNANTSMIELFPSKLAQLMEQCETSIATIRSFVCEKLTPMIPDIQAVGREAHGANVFAPKKVIMTYWPEESRVKTKFKKTAT